MTATLPPLPEASEANRIAFEDHWLTTRGGRKAKRELAHSPAKPDGYTCDSTQRHWWTWQCALSAIAAQAQPAPLTDEQIDDVVVAAFPDSISINVFAKCIAIARAIEIAHGISAPVVPTPKDADHV